MVGDDKLDKFTTEDAVRAATNDVNVMRRWRVSCVHVSNYSEINSLLPYLQYAVTCSVDGNTVHPVEEFTYLGSIQSSSSNSGHEYIRCIGLAANTMKRLECIWSQSKLSISMKLRIHFTCVLPILLHGSETWTLIQADWKRLDSFHVRCQ